MIRIALAILVLATPAYADKHEAERYFRAGEKAYHAQDFAAAAENFELALKEYDLPEIAFSAAQAYRRQYRVDPQRRYVERAVELYKKYLGKVKTGGRVADAADSLGEMQRELDKLGGAKGSAMPAVDETPKIGVTVDLADEQAHGSAMREIDESESGPKIEITATIDGNPTTLDRLEPVPAGEHVVAAVAPGYARAEKKVRAVAGAPQLVPLELQPLPARVTVKTEGGAAISVDGRHVEGLTFELPAGKHLLAVTKRGREVAGKDLVVTRAQTVDLDVPLEPTLRRRAVPWVAITAGTAGVFALAGWAVTLKWQRDAQHDLADINHGNASAAELDDYNTTRTRRDAARAGTIVLGSLAVGVGLTAAWLYYFDRPSAEGVHVAPVAGEGHAGAMLFGRF